MALASCFPPIARKCCNRPSRRFRADNMRRAPPLGLRPGKTMLLIILPQLIRIALPGLGNLWMITAERHRAGLRRWPYRHYAPDRRGRESHQTGLLLLWHRLPAVPAAGDHLLTCSSRIEQLGQAFGGQPMSYVKELIAPQPPPPNHRQRHHRRPRDRHCFLCLWALLFVGMALMMYQQLGHARNSPNTARAICPVLGDHSRWSQPPITAVRSYRCRWPWRACRATGSCPRLAYGYVYLFRGTPLLGPAIPDLLRPRQLSQRA